MYDDFNPYAPLYPNSIQSIAQQAAMDYKAGMSLYTPKSSYSFTPYKSNSLLSNMSNRQAQSLAMASSANPSYPSSLSYNGRSMTEGQQRYANYELSQKRYELDAADLKFRQEQAAGSKWANTASIVTNGINAATGVADLYLKWQAFKENKKSMEQEREIQREKLAILKAQWARNKAQYANLNSAWSNGGKAVNPVKSE